MTPMQEFAKNIVEEMGERGTSPSYVAARWRDYKHKKSSGASRDLFGCTSAAYRTLRSLEKIGAVKVEKTRTVGGYPIETYYPIN